MRAQGVLLGYSLLRANVAEHIQLLLVLSTHTFFLSGCAVETREFRGTASASNRVFPQPARPPVSAISWKKSQVLTLQLFRRIFLPRRFYPRQNPKTQEYDRSHDNPMRGHMHQVCGVNQSSDQDCETHRVKSERHSVSLASQRPLAPINSAVHFYIDGDELAF